MDLYTVTSLLTTYTLNTTAERLKVMPKDIMKFLESNGLMLHDGEVVPIVDMIPKPKSIELTPPKVDYVRRRTLGMDVATMKNWDEFTETHKEYNIYELVTLALNEFMDKYK